jgi:hypothetical protein
MPLILLPHVARVTAENVECYKTMELPAFHARWRALITEARDAIARVDAPEAAEGIEAAEAAARRAEARTALWDVGVRIMRAHHLLVRAWLSRMCFQGSGAQRASQAPACRPLGAAPPAGLRTVLQHTPRSSTSIDSPQRWELASHPLCRCCTQPRFSCASARRTWRPAGR